MIHWKQMDERERAVWSATVAAHFVARLAWAPKTPQEMFDEGAEAADLAVEAMREYLKDWPPFGEKP